LSGASGGTAWFAARSVIEEQLTGSGAETGSNPFSRY
jgi:hypothetical protein